ncbi:MAG: C45 family peptidase [Planctomycetota bacterium]|jgi:hypothetical protein
MRKALAVLLVALAAWALHSWVWPRPEPEAAPDRRATFHGARVEVRDGLTILRLAGPPRVKGKAYGAALAAPIRAWLERMLPRDPGVRAFAVTTCGTRLLRFVPADMRAELKGLAEGAGITLHEALYLNSRFELAAFRLVAGDAGADVLAGRAAVGPGPSLRRLFDAPDLVERPEAFLVLVHVDRDPPLVLVGLPGMVGGLLGLCGPMAAALCPMRVAAAPGLNGLVSPLLLRLLLENPPQPGGVLPVNVTFAASLPLRLPNGVAGTLNVAPSGAVWFPCGAFASTMEETASGRPGAIVVGRLERAARARLEERARALLGADAPLGIHLAGDRDGCTLEAWREDRRLRTQVRFFDREDAG